AIADMTTRPIPPRTERISMTVSLPPSMRTDTASPENASRAPVIQRTTRASCEGATGDCFPAFRSKRSDDEASLRVRLILRPRLVEGGKLQTGSVDGDDLGETIERHLEARRVVDLRHQADVGKRDLAAERVGTGLQQRFQCLEAVEDPVVIPRVDLGLL